MARRIPSLDQRFKHECTKAIRLTQSFELVYLQRDSKISIQNMEYVYEIAYLRIFVGWEVFLEQLLYRLFCGYETPSGQAILKVGENYSPNIAAAKSYIHGTQDYVLWHQPSKVIRRARKKLDACQYIAVIDSDKTLLTHFSSIRHRIAHAQDDARNKFDLATMTLCSRRFPASRPGRFLRYKNLNIIGGPTFLESISTDLINLGNQMCS